jgi:hypothetical protein
MWRSRRRRRGMRREEFDDHVNVESHGFRNRHVLGRKEENGEAEENEH